MSHMREEVLSSRGAMVEPAVTAIMSIRPLCRRGSPVSGWINGRSVKGSMMVEVNEYSIEGMEAW